MKHEHQNNESAFNYLYRTIYVFELLLYDFVFSTSLCITEERTNGDYVVKSVLLKIQVDI